MTIDEKYKIKKINNKRYYEFDMTDELPVLEETIPYYFKYKDFEVLRYKEIKSFFYSSTVYKKMKLIPSYNRDEFNFALEKHSRTREEEITQRFINEISK